MTDPPEKPNSDQKPARRNSPELPPSENDFWDLEDQEATDFPEPRASSQEAVGGPSTLSTPGADGDLQPKPKRKPKTDKAAKPTKDKDDKDSNQPQTLREAASTLTSGLSKSEKLGMIGVGALLLVIVGWAMSLFFSNVPTETPGAKIDFPVAGELGLASIGNATTYWQEPDPEIHRGVKANVHLIPLAQITLGSASKSGALRIFFKDDKDSYVGDPISLSFTDGKFADGSSEIVIHATGGFRDEGDHAAYLTEQVDKWHLIIKEGSDRNAPGSSFKDVLTIPISNARR